MHLRLISSVNIAREPNSRVITKYCLNHFNHNKSYRLFLGITALRKSLSTHTELAHLHAGYLRVISSRRTGLHSEPLATVTPNPKPKP